MPVKPPRFGTGMDRLCNEEPVGRDGVVNFRTPPWCLNSLSA